MRIPMTTLLLLAALNTFAQDSQTLVLHSTVSGNREQPRVAYIVPWQQPGATDFDLQLDNRIAQELFSAMDRYEFRRGLDLAEQRAAAPERNMNTLSEPDHKTQE